MAPPDPPAATLDNGRFVLLEKLGQGGMAVVWRARDTRLRVDRAIKILAGTHARGVNRVNRLQAEARAMARLDHRHIVKIQDVLDTDQGPAIVMDYIEGPTLDDMRRRTGALAPRSAVHWMIQILDGLDHAHAVGIIHRDVKPSNIMVNAAGDALLADFGIALVSTDEDRFTRTNISMGSVAFMAPEQRLDARSVGPTADVYAAATSLYDLVTGSTPIDLFTADLRSPRWADVPDALRQVLFDASRLDPARRTQSAAAFKAALERIEATLSDEPFQGGGQALEDTFAGPDGGGRVGTARPSVGTLAEEPRSSHPRARAMWAGPLLAVVLAFAVMVSLRMRFREDEGRTVPLVRTEEQAPVAELAAPPVEATEPPAPPQPVSVSPVRPGPLVTPPPREESVAAPASVASPAEAPVEPASLSKPRRWKAPVAWTDSRPTSHEGPSGLWMGEWTASASGTGGGAVSPLYRAYMTIEVLGAEVSCQLWVQASEAPAEHTLCKGTFDPAKGSLALADLPGTADGGTYDLHVRSGGSVISGMFFPYRGSPTGARGFSLSLTRQ